MDTPHIGSDLTGLCNVLPAFGLCLDAFVVHAVLEIRAYDLPNAGSDLRQNDRPYASLGNRPSGIET